MIKQILPILIIFLCIINSLQGLVPGLLLDKNVTYTENNSKIDIVSISPEYQLITDHEPQTNTDPRFYSTTYAQHPQKNNTTTDQKQQLKPSEIENNTETFDYVIITSENLYTAITSSSFIGWKTLIGHKIKIQNITDTEIVTQSGQDLPQKIRNYLRSNYQPMGIKYCLIIGSHTTIPMRYCYPDPTNHRFDIFDWTSGEVPTDYYYADLSGNDATSWDLDGDGYYGEYGQDQPDFLPEIYVGRIPVDAPSRITYTLDKITSFEQDTGEWKENALNAGAFFYFTNEEQSGNPCMDGAVLSYVIENDIMDDWQISHYSEQAGLETSIYNWPALTEAAFITDWRNGQYSIVNWQGHGWTNRVARKIWSWDDGDNIPEATEIAWVDFINTYSNLDDDYPSVVTAESCYVGCPETSPSGNLGIDLLTDPSMGAAIGVIASARSPYGSFEWPTNPGGSESILYEFNKYLVNDSKPIGEALYDAKYICNLYYGWDHYAEYIDMFTFNLFGEPSLYLKGIHMENLPPNPPIITGPAHGKIKVAIDYNFTTTDPDGDNVSYYIDWGDTLNSGWIGPYSSGDIVTKSHTWTKKGDYTIKAKAKDTYGAESDWAELSVTMPFSYNHPVLQFLKVLLEQFSNAFPMMRNLLGH